MFKPELKLKYECGLSLNSKMTKDRQQCRRKSELIEWLRCLSVPEVASDNLDISDGNKKKKNKTKKKKNISERWIEHIGVKHRSKLIIIIIIIIK